MQLVLRVAASLLNCVYSALLPGACDAAHGTHFRDQYEVLHSQHDEASTLRGAFFCFQAQLLSGVGIFSRTFVHIRSQSPIPTQSSLLRRLTYLTKFQETFMLAKPARLRSVQLQNTLSGTTASLQHSPTCAALA